jgi:hypothetical protein
MNRKPQNPKVLCLASKTRTHQPQHQDHEMINYLNDCYAQIEGKSIL